MANPASSFGFSPLRHQNGSPYNGQANEYEILAAYGTALFIGDMVKIVNTANAVDGTQQINAANGTSDRPVGAIVGFIPVLTNLSLQYHLASTLQRCLVADSPDIIFAVESDGTVATTDMGKYASVTTGTGSTVTGLSAMQLAEASVTATATTSLPLMVVGLYKNQTNVIGLNAIVEVIFITHIFRTATAV